MSKQKIIVVFTAKSTERILREGGTSSWRLDRNHARQCEYVLCSRNANADWVEGPEEHHTGFLVGKVKDVVPAPGSRSDDRYLIQFSEFACVDIPGAWKGDRNPVKYSTLEEFEIDVTNLKWGPMPEPSNSNTDSDSASSTVGTALTLLDAKKGLALTFGVAPEAIEITIRG
jgi:hypothetical protein